MRDVSMHEAPRPLTVLVADDDPEMRETMRAAVTSLGYDCALAADGLEAWTVQQRRHVDIILSDWKMPGKDGVQLCRQVRQRTSRRPYVHFILVSANDDKAHFLEGMKAGADDYITKPFDLEALGARLEAAGRIVAANRRLESTAAQLRKQSARNLRAARTDPLTSVPNRLELAEDLKAMAARALRYDHQYTAAMCDVDDFKAYNDHFGHVSGDDALRRIACAIRAQLRTGDGLYRYGGEEFFLVFPEQSIIEARIGMKRILCEIERLDLHHAPTAHHSVLTISAGIAQLRPNGPGCIEDWLRRADAALYLAKAAGRNRVEVEETSS